MPTIRNILTAFLISVGVAAGWLGLAALFPRPAGDVQPSLVATAAAAWINAHCEADVRLKSGAPRLMAEDLLRLSATFDVDRARNGLDAACRGAEAAAAAVSEPASVQTPAPSRTIGAVALH